MPEQLGRPRTPANLGIDRGRKSEYVDFFRTRRRARSRTLSVFGFLTPPDFRQKQLQTAAFAA
jgi:hypothetical protein